MPWYRIYGDEVIKYYTDLEAESFQEAYEMSNELDRHKWFQVESDSNIDPYDHEELIIDTSVHIYRGQVVDL